MPYPPPPGWFPPGQGFPPGAPPGPAPWNNGQPPSGPGGPPGPGAGPRQQGPNQNKDPKGGAPSDKAHEVPATEPKSLGQAARQPPNPPSLPVESKPSAEEVKAAASTLGNGSAPAGPKNARNTRPTPVIPLTSTGAKPFQLRNAGKPAQPAPNAGATAAPHSVEDATSAARAAVAVAMAQLGNSAPNEMDNLSSRVNEMRVNAQRNQPSGRGRGRGGHRQPAAKVEVPDSDFDFAQSNAKFNKDDVAKEAGPTDTPEEAADAPVDPETTGDSYNKSRSFFDNISSEAKDRAENNGQKPGGREWRGEEQRRNMETFGQGSVDGGYRNYRGRGRGRGSRGRGFNRGGRGGNRPQFQAADN